MSVGRTEFDSPEIDNIVHIQNKVDKHNEKHGDKAGKRVTLRMLTAVFKRGIGAYRTNPGSVRPSVTSEEQWAYA